MKNLPQRLQIAFFAISLLVAGAIILDFVLPGQIVDDRIVEVKMERQSHHNASGNSHYAYEVITGQHQFSVSEEFARVAQEREPIEYAVSRLFREINWYRRFASESKSVHSFRIATGLGLPLLAMLAMGVAFFYLRRTGTWLVVLQTLLLADLVYLLY
ncbi:MAG: hypothetical protein AAF998_26430 [Bacteroidota bacterium]